MAEDTRDEDRSDGPRDRRRREVVKRLAGLGTLAFAAPALMPLSEARASGGSRGSRGSWASHASRGSRGSFGSAGSGGFHDFRDQRRFRDQRLGRRFDPEFDPFLERRLERALDPFGVAPRRRFRLEID